MSKQSLLLIDGDARSLRVLEVSLRQAGFMVIVALSVQDALDKLELHAPDLMISETTFPDGDGFELLRRVRATPGWSEIPFIFVTVEAEVENKIRGLELGVDDYLTKPIYIKEIITRINIILLRKRASAQRSPSPLGSSSSSSGAASNAPPVPPQERERVARVFLSHASSDKPNVRRIAAALRVAGHEPWLDEEEILVGESIPAAVERGLRDADFVVLCLSEAARERGWVEAERDATLMQQFSQRKERVLPVRLEDVRPPHLIAALAYVDLFPDEQAFKRGIARLTRSIEAHQIRRAGPAGPSPASAPPIGQSLPLEPFSAPLDADPQPQSGRVEDVLRPRAASPAGARSRSEAEPAPIERRRVGEGPVRVAGTAVGEGPAGAVAVQSLAVRREEEMEALAKQLDDAYARREQLQEVGESVAEVAREILDLKRRLREGGQLRAGDRLGSDGRYQLIQQVGRGGFAVVWKAKDRRDDIYVAIKVLHANLSGDPERRKRFFRGARMMQNLDHPAVVRVLDSRCDDGGFWYFVMEFISNGTLHDAVLNRRLQGGELLAQVVRVGEALAKAHAQRIVHRDVKPQNILLDDRLEAKLADFDLVGAGDTTGGTKTSAMGTVIYAAPECLEKPQEATARADVFGLGMTAVFGLAGKLLTLSTLRNADQTIAGLDCSVDIKDVLRRAVAWEPEQRFADGGEMVAALRKAQADKPQPTAAARTPPELAEPGQQRPVEQDAGQPGMPVPLIPASAAALPQAPREGDEEVRALSDVEGPPAWAVASGDDRYGRWAVFEVKGMQHRMRWIPPGTFPMGSPEDELGRYGNEGPQHMVTLTHGYWLGEAPVTQQLWHAVMGRNPSRHGHGLQERRPVERVSWYDCLAFIEQLNGRVAGLAVRLPTEAEWERACRAGTTMATWVGDLSEDELSGRGPASKLESIAWYAKNSGGKSHSVGLKIPNPYGLCDMLGNVHEWCEDAADDYRGRRYSAAPIEDPWPQRAGSSRVVRGGSWSSDPMHVRAARRFARLNTDRDENLGFRLAEGPQVRHREDADVRTREFEKRLRSATTMKQRRLSRLALGFTCTAVLFGSYWMWLRSTNGAITHTVGDCIYEVDYPERVRVDDTFELRVIQECSTAAPHALAIEAPFWALSPSTASTDCPATSPVCTVTFNLSAGEQVQDQYLVALRVDHQPVMNAVIDKDRFATIRAVGERTVPMISFIPAILALVLSFHKEVRRYLGRLFGGDPP